jgi:predicted DCC family thiol-disulfide oxidoreductase YuxK
VDWIDRSTPFDQGRQKKLTMQVTPSLTLYFDGSCPLCQAEIEYLRHKDERGALAFIDITQAGVEIEQSGLSCERAMQLMQGRLLSGEVIEGVPVFATAYQLVGLRTLAWILSRPSLQGFLGYGYAAFAKRRHRFSRLLGPAALKISRLLTRQKTLINEATQKPS